MKRIQARLKRFYDENRDTCIFVSGGIAALIGVWAVNNMNKPKYRENDDDSVTISAQAYQNILDFYTEHDADAIYDL